MVKDIESDKEIDMDDEHTVSALGCTIVTLSLNGNIAMKTNRTNQLDILTESKWKRSVNAPQMGIEVKKGVVTMAGQVDGINAFNVELFAESFLKSPLAKAMLGRGEPLKFFLPIRRNDCAEWGGVDITIAGVTNEHIAKMQEATAAPDRGNGYSSNPHGPLKPGDFGVLSHPDTAKLMKNNPGRA